MCPVSTSVLQIMLGAMLYKKRQNIITSHGIYGNKINHDELFGYLCGSHFSKAVFFCPTGAVYFTCRSVSFY